MARFIEVVDYRTDWLDRYESEAGMRAKPIIDILVEVERGVDVDSFNLRMSELGYDCRGECLDAIMPGTPGRFYFSKSVKGMRSFHMHVTAVALEWGVAVRELGLIPIYSAELENIVSQGVAAKAGLG